MTRQTEHKSSRDEQVGKGLTVLQVIPRLESGGAERTTLEVARALIASGGYAVVATAGGRFVPELESVGAIVNIMPVDSKNPFVIWRNVTRLMSAIRRHNINLVHARSRAPAWSSYFAAKRCQVPFVATHHGTYQADSWGKRYYNSIMVRGDRVIANSKFIAAQISKTYHLPTDRIEIVPRGVDERAFDLKAISDERKALMRREWGLEADERRIILLPARLTRWKGQRVLIDAAERLLHSGHKDFVCVLLGDAQGSGTYQREIFSLIRDRHLSDIVKMPGYCSDMPTAYALCSVVVSPSTDPEAFGRVAIEAQAMERPVIVSDHGGAQETVIDGVTGWRVSPGDSEALARALEEALSLDAKARRSLGERARAHVHRAYSVDQMCARTMTLYQDLAGCSSAADEESGV